ncbi:leucine-rich repeat, cysteine-containing subtype protein [Tanacetum coccineum]
MELVARSCPNLQHLKLNHCEKSDFDFDDDGLCAVAKACSRFNEVQLDGRLHVGDVGVDCLVISCKEGGRLGGGLGWWGDGFGAVLWGGGWASTFVIEVGVVGVGMVLVLFGGRGGSGDGVAWSCVG